MSKLFIVATPIGNLEDMTLRAINILKSVDIIACEDTRQSKKLLEKYEIKKTLVSYHQHSKIAKTDFLIKKLKEGKQIAVISDAGTPGISDPGNILVAKAVEAGISIVPIPGPSALAAALSVSGFPSDRFVFFGFIPHKKGREKMLKQIAEEKKVVVFYESVHRILKTLNSLTDLIGSRKVVVCRELTKQFESIYRGATEQILKKLKKDKIKGEFVVVIDSK